MAKLTPTVAAAKERAKRAHAAARAGDTISAAIYDRWLANTLSAAAGQDEEIAAAMFTRLAIALEVMQDMRGWPAGIVAGLTVSVQPQKRSYRRPGV
jgi:hypothetical protein